MNPRILFVNHAAVIGGAELILLDVARAFRDSADVALFSDGPFRGMLENAGVRVHLLRAAPSLHRARRESKVPPPGAIAATLPLIGRLALRARAYDLLYANTQKAFVVACAAGLIARRPVLWHLHDILTPEHFSPSNIRLDVALGNRVARRILTVSHAAAEAFIEQGGEATKTFVVHNGIDPEAFHTLGPEGVAAVRAEWDVGERPLLGCFSRLTPWKGQHVLIEAMARLPGAELLLAGTALFGQEAYEAQLRAQVRRLRLEERVHFLGHRTDVPRLMQAVDVIVHPPVAPEPFGRVVIESMLAGKPLVASQGGGTVEIITDKESGLLFPSGDAAALAAAVASLLSDPQRARALGEKARIFATTHLSREAMVVKVARHISEIVGKEVLADPSAVKAEAPEGVLEGVPTVKSDA